MNQRQDVFLLTKHIIHIPQLGALEFLTPTIIFKQRCITQSYGIYISSLVSTHNLHIHLSKLIIVSLQCYAAWGYGDHQYYLYKKIYGRCLQHCHHLGNLNY